MINQISKVFKSSVAIHIAVWILIFLLPTLLTSRQQDNLNEAEAEQVAQFFRLSTITFFYWVVIFYFSAYVITPRFIYTKSYVRSALILILIFTILMVVHSQIHQYIMVGRPFNWTRSMMHRLPTFVLAVTSGFMFKLLSDRNKEEKQQQQKEEENLKTELSFLRSQISPHFIFNVLNNIVAMVRLKSEDLEPTVMKLSSLMRYMLYETNEEKVPLSREAKYLQSYIDLQMQRFGTKVKLTTEIEIADESIQIEPMLLIPFVENAFKHGIGQVKNPMIEIQLKTTETQLVFQVKNAYNPDVQEEKDETSGIGLPNVERRLDLLYGKDHTLTITNDNNIFHVYLAINWKHDEVYSHRRRALSSGLTRG